MSFHEPSAIHGACASVTFFDQASTSGRYEGEARPDEPVYVESLWMTLLTPDASSGAGLRDDSTSVSLVAHEVVLLPTSTPAARGRTRQRPHGDHTAREPPDPPGVEERPCPGRRSPDAPLGGLRRSP